MYRVYHNAMLSTPHIVTGIAIATKTTNPILAIPLAFMSHFILDMVPHWNPHLNTEMRTYGKITTRSKTIIIIDTVVGTGIVLAAALTAKSPDAALLSFACASAAILPDAMEAPYFFFHWKTDFIMKWIRFQKAMQSDANVFWGTLTQIITILAAVLWIS